MYVGRQSETAFENTQWRKIKQMQPVHLCIRSGKRFHLSCKTCRKRIIIRIKIHDHMNKIHNRHTVVKSILSVKHVETNTPKLNFWRNTCVVIVERGLLSARSADDLLDFYRHWMNTTTNTTTVLLLLKEKMLQPQIQPPRYKTPHKQLDTRQGQSPTVSDCHRGEK